MLKNIDDIGIARLTSLDVVRHPLVQKIVNAYEQYEKRLARTEKKTSVSDKRSAKHR